MATNVSEEELEDMGGMSWYEDRSRGHYDPVPYQTNVVSQSAQAYTYVPPNHVLYREATIQMLSVPTNIESVGTYEAYGPSGHQYSDYCDKDIPKRTVLPISAYEDQIVEAIHRHRVVVIEGPTGSGKTTQVPQFIADNCAANDLPFNIVVTQPRRIAAKSTAARVAQESGVGLGSYVGYQIGMDKIASEDTRLLYCTTGVLLQRLIATKEFYPFSHIVIDEIHERSIETDLLLLVIKKLMNKRRNRSVKIVLMSATFDPQKLIEYFTFPILDGQVVVDEIRPTFIRVEEKPHDLYIYYMEDIRNGLGMKSTLSREYRGRGKLSGHAIEVAVAILERGLEGIEIEESPGSVLVFLPGIEEIYRLIDRLEKSRKAKQWRIHVLHSSVPFKDQSLVFSEPIGRKRKIILATNIAQSAITVPDVSYVIDFCLTKTLVCDLETNIPVLRLEWAPKADCSQRAGRTGRVSAGRVYRLVDKEFYDSLNEFSAPELVRSPLEQAILNVKVLNMGSPKELLDQALDPPDLRYIYNSVLNLKRIGAFTIRTTSGDEVYYDREDGDITTLGKILCHLPIDIRLGKLIVFGHLFDVLEDCIIISACLSTEGLFRRDFKEGLIAQKSKLSWADRSSSDGIACLNAYKMYKRFSAELCRRPVELEDWCETNFLQYQRIIEAENMVDRLTAQLSKYNNIRTRADPNPKESGPQPESHRNRCEDQIILKVVMCAAFYPNFFSRKVIDNKDIPKQFGAKEPFSSVLIEGLPPNDGPLYTDAISELFSVASKRIDIEFNGSTAYLTFLDDNHSLRDIFGHPIPKRRKLKRSHNSMSAGDSSALVSTSSRYSAYKKQSKDSTIKTGVYVAIAMKKYPEISKQILKLNREETERRLQSIIQSNVYNKQQLFGASRVSVPYMRSRTRLPMLELPALECAEVDIRITHIVNPNHFYAQYMNDKAVDLLLDIMRYYSPTIAYTTARIGDYVIAEYDNTYGLTLYGRARVENIEYEMKTKNIQSITIFFIDYGFTQTVNNTRHISEINADVKQILSQIPPQAFQCSLALVKPSPVSRFDSQWSEKSVENFKNFVKHYNSLNAKIYSVVNRVVRVELFGTTNNDESYNDILIKSGLAELREESLSSKSDHILRRKAQAMCNLSGGDSSRHSLGLNGDNRTDEAIELEIDFQPIERSADIRSPKMISIRGPYSPLECSFVGLTHQLSSRSVKILRDSVNCVVLEPDYLCKHSRLLVASSIGLSQNTGELHLRDTTLMPNIRGFPALMALLFAPRVQLRANRDREQYVSAICGLGYDKRSLMAFDPNYDIEIIFDSEISPEDMKKVNLIRSHVNNVLESETDFKQYPQDFFVGLQRTLRSYVIELLCRRRRLIRTSSFDLLYNWTGKWNQMKEMDINSQLYKTDSYINSQLLALCEQPLLKEYDWCADIKKNLSLFSEPDNSTRLTTSACKLCHFTATDVYDVMAHMKTTGHTDAVKEFEKFYDLSKTDEMNRNYCTPNDGESDSDDE